MPRRRRAEHRRIGPVLIRPACLLARGLGRTVPRRRRITLPVQVRSGLLQSLDALSGDVQVSLAGVEPTPRARLVSRPGPAGGSDQKLMICRLLLAVM